jgi:hypothetical protein
MNFQEFLNYKNNCPSCGAQLGLNLSSTRDYKHKMQNTSYVFSTTIKSINHKQAINIDLIMDPTDNSFYVEFYDRAHLLMNKFIPLSFINSFKNFNEHQKVLSFKRRCNICYKYKYYSEAFTLDFKTSKLECFFIRDEYSTTTHKIDNDNSRSYKIIYDYNVKTTDVFYNDIKNNDYRNLTPFEDYIQINYCNKITVPYRLEVFDGVNNFDKLETLITFS